MLMFLARLPTFSPVLFHGDHSFGKEDALLRNQKLAFLLYLLNPKTNKNHESRKKCKGAKKKTKMYFDICTLAANVRTQRTRTL